MENFSLMVHAMQNDVTSWQIDVYGYHSIGVRNIIANLVSGILVLEFENAHTKSYDGSLKSKYFIG